MRYILTAFLFYVTLFNYAQVSDDFSDGDFNNNPVWVGDAVNFEVDVNHTLHLNAPSISDTMYLATANLLANDAEWNCLVELDFNPSSANLARIYLMSDVSNLTGSLNGYFIQVGGTEDEVSLYKQTGFSTVEIIDGIDGFLNSSNVSVRIKASRTTAGDWALFADNTGSFNFINQGIVTDNTFNTTNHFGIFCKYTSTRSDKFYFDDFLIEPMTLVDTVLPQVAGVEVVSDQVLVVTFSENVDVFTAENTANYSASNGLGAPSLAEVIAANPYKVELTYPPAFQEGVNYTLLIQNVADDSGNVISDTTVDFTYTSPFLAGYKGVVITEIMADPNPVVGLPDVEYLELYNNTDQTISLENWTISDGTTTLTLPNQAFLPHTYLLLYQPAAGVNFAISNTIEGPIPSLNNAGDNIVLKDDSGFVIDSVAYTVGWYNNITKATGGWSLELKNLNSPCHDAGNWSASENAAGGTPGYENSINDTLPNAIQPKIIEVFIENDSSIHFVFDKIISDGMTAINPSIPYVQTIVSTELIITLLEVDPAETYEVAISGYKDCWGNEMDRYNYAFALPEMVGNGDIIINEILFNPITGGSDYVELVNISNKVLALNDIQIANIENGTVDNSVPLSSKQILWFPGAYLLLSEDSLSIIETFPSYEPGHFLNVDLPSYNNDSGTVILLSVNGELLDHFSYSEELHFQLIDDLNGKALERLSFSQPTQSEANWHTASQNVDWGTPGYLNSQTSNPVFDLEVQLSQAIFSPDNDGYQDVLELTYQFDNPDNVMDVTVYNAYGQPVRELKDNYYPGQKGVIVWDGLTDQGNKANIGTYIIGVTVFDLEGNVKRYKLVGVLATRL
jgi:hypothetical protein